MMQSPAQTQVVYQADPEALKTIQSIQTKMNQLGGQLRNRKVRVQTSCGHIHEGFIVHVDGDFLYLNVQQDQYGMNRQWLNPLASAYHYNNVILPLVLYNLLVITLLYT